MNSNIGFDYSKLIFYNYDEGLFTILYHRKTILPLEKVNEILDLINECYPNSLFKEDYFCSAYDEVTIEEYKTKIYKQRSEMMNDIIFRINVYIQGLGSKLYSVMTQVGLNTKNDRGKVGGTAIIEFKIDNTISKYSDNKIYGIKLYPYAYFDFVTINNVKYDQRKAAKKNRKNLRQFLIEFERIIDGELIGIDNGDSRIDKFLYKYGVKEEAEIEL